MTGGSLVAVSQSDGGCNDRFMFYSTLDNVHGWLKQTDYSGKTGFEKDETYDKCA